MEDHKKVLVIKTALSQQMTQ